MMTYCHVTYPWLAATRLIPGPAVAARTSLAVVSPSYHGEGCNRLGCDPWGYMADSGQAWRMRGGVAGGSTSSLGEARYLAVMEG